MKKIIAANWKMQLSPREAVKLAGVFANKLSKSGREIIICPDFVALSAIASAIKKSRLSLGAQDCAPTSRGAYTGEVSPVDLRIAGVKYVIIGHSERRQIAHEDGALIRAKIIAALESGLTPILCIGESAVEKKSGRTRAVLAKQLSEALRGIRIKSSARLIVAYEPVWAISSQRGAKALSPSEADGIQSFISARAARLIGFSPAVLYGGSVSAANAGSFLAQKNVSGLLIGGASLRLAEMQKICQ